MKHIFAAVLMLSILGGTAAFAQGVESKLALEYARSWVSDDEFATSDGISVLYSYRLSKKVSLRFSYTHTAGDDSRFGYLIAWHSYEPPPSEFVKESVDQHRRFNFYKIGFLHSLTYTRQTALLAGGGISLLKIRETETGETTGRMREVSYALRSSIDLDVALIIDDKTLPISLLVEFTHRFFVLGTEEIAPGSSDAERDAFTTTEIHIGLGYWLPWGNSRSRK
ncbi:MAG: hypothetical protein ABIJ61_08095 [bacterium]